LAPHPDLTERLGRAPPAKLGIITYFQDLCVYVQDYYEFWDCYIRDCYVRDKYVVPKNVGRILGLFFSLAVSLKNWKESHI
jgi:hypothetical protein